MKYRWDKKYLYWGLTAFSVIAACIIFSAVIGQIPRITNAVGLIIRILSPIIYGLAIAYLLMPAVDFCERKMFRPLSRKMSRKDVASPVFSRAASVALVLAVALFIVTMLLWLVLPQIFVSIKDLVNRMPAYVEGVQKWLNEFFRGNEVAEETVSGIVESLSTFLTTWVNDSLLPQANQIITSVSDSVLAVLRGVINFLVGIIVSVYVMYGRDTFIAQSKRILYSVFKPKMANSIMKETSYLNKIFGGFISGQLLDSFLVGIICFCFMTILRIPYAPLIGMIVGVTNIIPFFGPFIGAIPSAFLIFIVDPVKCLIFIIFILIMQQIDGNIISPRILSNSLGMRGFWIITAILLGGGLFGFIGMVLGVPLFTAAYMGVRRIAAHVLEKKDLPTATEDYLDIDYVDAGTNEPIKKQEKPEFMPEKRGGKEKNKRK